MQDLGALLRGHREARGLLQEELAALVEPALSVNTIGNVERGRTRPHRHTLDALAAALDLNPEQKAELTRAWRANVTRSTSGPSSARPFYNLPRPVTPLIGREHEVGVITTQIRSPAVQLLTLTGAGGIGKSRLALAAAEALLDEFDNAVWFVPLAPLANPSQVTSAIAQALEVPDAGGHLSDNLREFLKPRRSLLILDNFEHLLPAATLVLELVSSAPGLKVLVTSRELLHLSTEHTLEVPPLRLATRAQAPSLNAVLQSDAVQLFLDRAYAVEPDFFLTDSSALSVAEICRRLDGLPLAIELAAARIKHVALPTLSRLLERSLSVLTGGAPDLPVRQQTLRSTIAWSYDFLTPADQAVFRRLAVFAGGCTLEAAEAVCVVDDDPSKDPQLVATIDVLNRLASLIDKSLLRFESSAGGEPRYVMLETVREFGIEQLVASGEEAIVRERHALYYEALALGAAEHFLMADQLVWIARVDNDLDNLRATFDWLAESNQFDRGQYLTGSLWYYWSIHCRVSEGLEWLRCFLDDERGRSTSELARAWGYLARNFIAMRQDDMLAMHEAGLQCLKLARGTGNSWLIAMALARVAFAAERMQTRTIAPQHNSPQADPVDVSRLYEDALGTFRALADDWATAQCLFYYCRFLSSRDPVHARTLALEAVERARRIGERNALGMALSTLANLDLDLHDTVAARPLVEESLTLADELNDVFNASQRLGTLAQLADDELRFKDALDLLERCVANFQLLGNRSRAAHARHDLGFAARMAGEVDRAADSFRESTRLFRELGLVAEAAAVTASLGHLQRQRAALAEAAHSFEESWRVLESEGTELAVPTVLAGLGGLALEADHPVEAVRLLGAAEALLERLHAGPEGVLNTTRPSLRGYQLRRDAAHTRELQMNLKAASRVTRMSAEALRAAVEAGRSMSASQACTLGLDLVRQLRRERSDSRPSLATSTT